MQKLATIAIALALIGCAQNPRHENTAEFNEQVVRGKVKGFASVAYVKSSHATIFSTSWDWYLATVPTTQAKDEDLLMRISTDEGGILFSSDIFKSITDRQLVHVPRVRINSDKEIGQIRYGDIVDVQFPTWDTKTRTRDRDITLLRVVCKSDDKPCKKEKAQCFGIVNSKTDSACD